MKKFILFLMLAMAIPAMTEAQTGLFGPRRPYSTHASDGHSQRPLFREGRHRHHHAPVMEEMGMNPRDYDDAFRIISEENFDEKRLATAKRIIADNPMNARQIANICKLFSFDANRLDFAKFAYHHCVDANKYFLVDETFTFESSKKALYEYIHHDQH